MIVNFALSIKPDFNPTIFTPRFHKSFPPCHDGRIKVETHGGFLPRHIKGKFYALMAYLRTILCTLWAIFFSIHYEVFIVDQISAVVPILKLCGRKVIFYCHFPDKALSTDRKGIFKKIYRLWIDLW